MQSPFTIDVISDVICPWCFLGKRRLDAALAQLGGLDVLVRWRPFMLDASIPPEGMDRQAYLSGKFGPDRLRTLHDPIIEAAAPLGIPFDFEAITRTPNTLDAHRLIRWSHTADRQHQVADRLFTAYWCEGQDIGQPSVLARCAGEAGLNAQQISELLASDQDVDATRAEIAHATNIGVTGVPTFILGQRYALQGAQPPEVIADAITRSLDATVNEA